MTTGGHSGGGPWRSGAKRPPGGVSIHLSIVFEAKGTFCIPEKHGRINPRTMHRVLGIRAVPDGFYWAVIEGSVEAPIHIASDRVVSPTSYDEPAALSWCRDRLRHLIESYKPSCVAIRMPEAFARGTNTDSARRRNRIEGVLIEGANSNGVIVHAAALATMSKNLGVKSAKVLLSDPSLKGLDWSGRNDNTKEAIMVAVSGLGC